jgi:hypothetical protein
MRNELREAHVNVPAVASYAQIFELHETWIENQRFSFFNQQISDTVYPLLDDSALGQYSLEVDGPIKELKRLKVSELGELMQDDDLPAATVSSILDLLAALVTIDAGNNEKKLPAVYKVMPDLLVKFANGSRAHEGLRLLKRSVRHAIDPVTPDIMAGTLMVCEFRGQIGIGLFHKVQASMRGIVCDTAVVFTKEDLVACRCSCRCGSSDGERIVDVHPLALIYQLVLLLFDGLAENLLVELRSRLQSEEENEWNKQSVLALMSAAGKGTIGPNFSVEEILQCFTVGTDLTKRSPGRPNAKDLGLLRKVFYQQPVTVAKRKQEHEDPLGEKDPPFEFSDEMKFPSDLPLDAVEQRNEIHP